ncbi:Calcium-binding ef-hand-containing protein [Quillaja saponaria]|uniref:Calcium-binding ef-hand-containing protein n=1 Tax=Quillaja saponaria TaxID=32244 RepID=A0AAD7LZ21_QUISA|nr:Calcium-binding ef-hand-containing protein [Quillaja saponaria]
MAGTATDQFEAYFKRADLDGDGRISGVEAVAFFQGSNLPKNVLAQIWMHADQAKTGFLGRTEFFNALKLVTVAQSKRDLTPDIVKAALYGPAAAKIPPPQINLAALSPPQSNTMAAAPSPQMGAAAATSSQNFGLRGQGFLGPGLNQQYPSQQNQTMRPPQLVPASTASRPPQGITGPEVSRGGGMVGPNVPNPNISSDWLSGRTGTAPTGPRGISQSVPSSTLTLQTPVPTPSHQTTVDSKTLVVSGNGFSSNSAFGGDLFSAPSSIPKQEHTGQTYSASIAPTSLVITPVSSGSQPSSKQNALDSLQAFSLQATSGQFQQTQSSLNPSQQISAPGSSSLALSGISVAHGNATSDNSHIPWPKMKPSDVQKYMKVFMQVDTDRDGKITGEQARNLFLSWRLPREVLKQVWDLSDQDNDSMLSLREFCFALYLMEQYRGGRPLPAALPSNVTFDETLLSMTGQSKMTYGNAAWTGPGFGQQQGIPGTRPMAPATGLRPPIDRSPPRADGTVQANQQNSGAPVLENSFLNQSDNMELNVANSMHQEATSGVKKAEETENLILDSREKIEFYRTKMQELVLYKSRCDNRLNEITERALADKREAESLAKKYEEKYKQVAEIASKLIIEEAKFRDIQERKTELHQAIVKMEQGGSVDGILQVRADRIQSDLDELFRALTERCKKHEVDVKSSAIVELPIGWQPGIPEGAADWDEDWDKFEDEGFVNDLAHDVKNASSNTKFAFNQTQQNFPDDNSSHGLSLDTKGKQGDSLSNGDYPIGSESAYTHSEDDVARSPHDSPAGRTAFEIPSHDFSDVHFEKSSEADAETHRSFDDSTWGAFDNNDDVDSVWGFNTVNTKNSDSEKQRDFFGSDNFGLSPVRTASPHADSIFQTKSPFTFEDSVPGTPLSKFGNSPRYSEAGDHFDNLSSFDSFSMHDSGFTSHPERLTRFDSISSSKDLSYNHDKFTRFDSISSSRDFGYNHERLTRFDSINSTKDFSQSGAFSFDDTDPFGSSGPFKVSSDSQTPKRNSDNWSAF